MNRPWALALAAAWRARCGDAPENRLPTNDALIVQLDDNELAPEDVLTLVRSSALPGLLRAALEDSGFFGARFRECAGRALLVTRKRFNARLPLWMTRLQSKKLLNATRQLDDFPILLEAWRTCLEDEFDLPALSTLLDALHDGEISWHYTENRSPSPFAADLSWNQINRYMYADDTPKRRGASQLDADLLASTFADRPRVSRAVIDAFLSKRQRRHPEYRPAGRRRLARLAERARAAARARTRCGAAARRTDSAPWRR